MFNKLVTYSKFGNLFCGIEHTSINEVETINGLVLKKKQNTFSIHSNFQVATIEELKNHIGTEQHIFLIINNQKVLFKSLDGVLDTKKAIALAFPNIKIEDFFYEIHVSNNKTFIAICRKDIIEKTLAIYESNKFNIIGFSLGNLMVLQLKDFTEEPQIQTSNSIVSFTNNAISDIITSKVQSNKYSINGLIIKTTQVLSLAGILSYYINQVSTISNFTSNINALKRNFSYKRSFSLGLKTGLGIVFTALLVSFLFFSNYSLKVEALRSSLAIHKSQKKEFLQLTHKINKKEKLITDFSLASSKSSWYLDQLVMTIPNSIRLSEIQWRPLIKKIKEEQEIITKENVIIVKGISTNTNHFSQWMRSLEMASWIENLSINEYGKGKKSIVSFEIELVIKK